MKPMLCLATSDAAARELKAPRYAAMLKVDGVRALIDLSGSKPISFNRKGERSYLPGKLLAELGQICGLGIVLDGELVKDELYLFDLVRAGSDVNERTPWAERHDWLERIVGKWNPEHITLLPVARTNQQIAGLRRRVLGRGLEGMVIVDTTSRYEFGGRSGAWRKWKFVKTATCLITAKGLDGKDNFEVSLLDNGVPVPIGTISRLEGDAPHAKLGDLIDVEFLHAGDPATPRLTQPHPKKLRRDKRVDEATIDQITHAFREREVVLS